MNSLGGEVWSPLVTLGRKIKSQLCWKRETELEFSNTPAPQWEFTLLPLRSQENSGQGNFPLIQLKPELEELIEYKEGLELGLYKKYVCQAKSHIVWGCLFDPALKESFWGSVGSKSGGSTCVPSGLFHSGQQSTKEQGSASCGFLRRVGHWLGDLSPLIL